MAPEKTVARPWEGATVESVGWPAMKSETPSPLRSPISATSKPRFSSLFCPTIRWSCAPDAPDRTSTSPRKAGACELKSGFPTTRSRTPSPSRSAMSSIASPVYARKLVPFAVQSTAPSAPDRSRTRPALFTPPAASKGELTATSARPSPSTSPGDARAEPNPVELGPGYEK